MKDVDQSYADTGEQLMDPIDTFEKIYLIVRNITNRNVKQQYELKKHDITNPELKLLKEREREERIELFK